MEYSGFLNWLLYDKQLSVRSARDVVSRLKRCITIIGNETLSQNHLDILQKTYEFERCSMSVKSQLKRAITLYIEYKK